MQFSWLYTTLLSIIWFAAQANTQYTSSSVYTPPPYSYGPPDYGSPTTVTVTTVTSTTVTSLSTTTTTATETIYTKSPYGYDNTYVPPVKKHTALIIGLVVGLCGLAIILLVAFLLWRKKPKPVEYGPKDTTYGKDTTTPVASY